MTKIIEFKRIYVSTYKACLQLDKQISQNAIEEPIVEQIVQNIKTLVEMLPLELPVKIDERNRCLPINLNDAEDTPNVPYPEDTLLLYEYSIHIALEDWKFRVWNTILEKIPDNIHYQQLYLEPVLQQAEMCVDILTANKNRTWAEWEKNMLTIIANAVGWCSYLYISETERLQHALTILDKAYGFAGFRYSDWTDRKFIHDTKVRLLLKLKCESEAYSIIYQTLTTHPECVDFDDLKVTQPYLKWVKNKKKQEKAAIQKAKEEKIAFDHLVKAEQEKVVNLFLNPSHVLVIKYAETLNLIKQRMIALQLRKQYYESGWEKMKKKVDDDVKDNFTLKPWSEKKITNYETKHQIQLPEELKAYLLEIGEGGGDYFCWGDPIKMEKKKNNIQAMKKPFPITSDKIHDINHYWKIKAWVMLDDYFSGEEEEDLTDLIKYLKKKKILHKNNTLKELFSISNNYEEGCLSLGYSNGQDALYMVMNGEFEGEIWVDTLQYGIEMGGCFGAATPNRQKLLSFIAGSLLANMEGYVNSSEEGAWL